MVKSNIPTISSVKPYTPLELEGRDLYIREGCVGCHSQMIRPFRSEVERYGEYSKAGEFVYDHPFLWGSKRTGPDLHREGGLRNDAWHYKHMYDPRGIEETSIMPAYPWLIRDELDKTGTQGKMRAMVTLGVPYTEQEIAEALQFMDEQAIGIVENLKQDPDLLKSFEKGRKIAIDEGTEFIEIKDREIIALIAYLQRLGTDIKVKESQEVASQNK